MADAEQTATLVKSLPVPICVLGLPLPDTICTLHTGWGWTGAARLHLERARTLFETGTLIVDGTIEGKESLLEQDFYDRLISDWATRTGRPAR
jgi:hypothetical protein